MSSQTFRVRTGMCWSTRLNFGSAAVMEADIGCWTTYPSRHEQRFPIPSAIETPTTLSSLQTVLQTVPVLTPGTAAFLLV